MGKTFHLEDDPFSMNVEGFSKIYHEVLLIKKIFRQKFTIKVWI